MIPRSNRFLSAMPVIPPQHPLYTIRRALPPECLRKGIDSLETLANGT